MKFRATHDTARVETEHGMSVKLTGVATGRRTPSPGTAMQHGSRVTVDVRTADDRFTLSLTKFEGEDGVEIGLPSNMIMKVLHDDAFMSTAFDDPKFAQRFKALMLIHLDKLNGA